MPDLIPVALYRIGSNEVESVDGRVLHTNLGLESEYAAWIKTWLRKANLVNHRDYEVFVSEVKNPKGGRPTLEYALSVEAAKCIAMMSGGKRGDEVRLYFIAREQQAIAMERQHSSVQVKNPANQMLIESIVRIDTLEQAQEAQQAILIAQQAAIIAAQQKALDGFLLAERAEAKADIALEDIHRMTVEEYVIKNGLQRQYPPPSYPRIAAWLGHFCEQWGLDVRKAPVLGKPWDNENAYPLQAVAAFHRYELKRPKQITLVPYEGTRP